MNKNYKLGLYEKAMPSVLSWSEKFQEAKAAGFDYVEISIDESADKLARLEYSEGQILKIVEAGRSLGICLGSICLSGHRKYPLGGENPRSMEIMENAIRFAKIAGIPVIQLAGYDVYYTESTKETVDKFATNLKKATMIAASEGILLGFETMETPFMDTVEKSMKFVNMVDSPYLNVYPDLGNLTNASLIYKKSVEEDLMSGKGKIIATHIKETVVGKYREIPFNTGHVNFKSVIDKAWELGSRRFVTELWYTGSEKWREDIAFASSFARSFLDKEDN
ncbi:MAG: L-ribulose-5-phosphate 3-epimerase [Spirochaetaceae bacterium]|nr:L-ribulose-5-phosphate 3-epimerase [Spirochaetaceae bacterium]